MISKQIKLQNVIIDKLCPPTCLHLSSQTLEEMKQFDQQQNNPNPYLWMDEQFKLNELEAAIASSKNPPPQGLIKLITQSFVPFPSAHARCY